MIFKGCGSWKVDGWFVYVLLNGGFLGIRWVFMCFLGFVERVRMDFWVGGFFGYFIDFCCVRNIWWEVFLFGGRKYVESIWGLVKYVISVRFNLKEKKRCWGVCYKRCSFKFIY